MSDKDTPGSAFKGGTKFLQLFGCESQRGSWELGQTCIAAIHKTIL